MPTPRIPRSLTSWMTSQEIRMGQTTAIISEPRENWSSSTCFFMLRFQTFLSKNHTKMKDEHRVMFIAKLFCQGRWTSPTQGLVNWYNSRQESTAGQVQTPWMLHSKSWRNRSTRKRLVYFSYFYPIYAQKYITLVYDNRWYNNIIFNYLENISENKICAQMYHGMM